MNSVKAVSSNPILPQSAPTLNYLDRIVQLVAKSLSMQTQSKTYERFQIEELKKKYELFSLQSGQHSVSMGNTQFWAAMAGFGMMLLSQSPVLPNILTPDHLKYFGEHGCTALSQAINSRSQSKQKQADAVASLALNEYQSKTSNQSNSTNQDAINLLNQVVESLKRASAS